jgi:Rrf2 family nitric oxide-sensitive transcriptional repressor
MRLTYHTDYALRMLIHLEANRGRATRVADVADSYGLSRNHLLKVALRLGRLGYVTTLRGRAGGIALARDASDINLGAVVRQMEDDFAAVECLRQDGGLCVIAPACRLKGIVGRAIEAFLSVFDEYTLADITGNRAVLAQLLSLAEPSPAAA